MNIRDFHINHGYYIQIKPLPHTVGFASIFPPNKVLGINLLERTYILNSNNYTIELYVKEQNRKIISKEIQATKSNIRLLVLQDLFLYTYSVDISEDLIVTDTSLWDLLYFDKPKHEVKQELKLYKNFKKTLRGDVVTENIDGFDQLLFCLENGGL